MPEPVSQSLTVIDATNAEVLAPEAAPVVLSDRQTEELEKCQFHLLALGRKISAREIDLIYHYVEAGWWLMRARATHLVAATATRSSDGRLAKSDGGFLRWLEAQNIGVKERQAYAWMQGAQNAGLTPESTILALQTLKAEHKLHGRTLTDICRKPVDKTDKQAELHEVTDEEQAKLDEEERNDRWQAIAAQLHNFGIEQDEWAKLSTDRRAGLYDLLTELAKRIKPSLRKLKPAPAAPALPENAPASEPHPWRVGQRTGQARWQIKHAPGWGVTHEVESIEAAATWLRDQGVDLNTVDVLTVAPWPTLAAHLEAQPPEPEPDGDRVCTQADIERGLWWYGWIGVRDTIMVKNFHGDMKEIIEGRAHPRVGKTFVGPFYAETLADAEKAVREQNIHAKI